MSRIPLAVVAAKVSAQSPPCSRNASPAATDGQPFAQGANLVGGDQRRRGIQLVDGGRQLGRIRPARLLRRREVAPGIESESGSHVYNGTGPVQPVFRMCSGEQARAWVDDWLHRSHLAFWTR